MINSKLALIPVMAFSLQSCATVQEMVGNLDEVAETPAVSIKPELDYSNESPDCITAGQRLAENIEVGMSLDEVTRLVGKPRIKLPGSWWWSASFREAGVPVVKFQFGAGAATKPVKSFSSDVEMCGS